MFIGALVIITKIWRQPREWTNGERNCGIYMPQRDSASKREELLPFALTQMDLEDIMLNEISQTQKEKTLQVLFNSFGYSISSSYYYFLLKQSLILLPGWSTVVQSPLTTTSTSWVQEILVPQPPEQLGLEGVPLGWLIFIFFSKDGVLPCWPVWYQIPGLK